jgi:hypothetical protein
MLSARKRIFVWSKVIATSLLVFIPVSSRSQESPEDRQKISKSNECVSRDGDFGPTESENRAVQAFLLSERAEDRRTCELSKPGGNQLVATSATAVLTASVTEPDRPTPAVSLARGPALRDIGEEGTNISRARQAVLALLQEQSACSAWFRQADPEIDKTFWSLSIAVDEDGSNHVVRELSDTGSLFEHGPYIARSFQRGGPGSNISINANGAFFRAKASVYRAPWVGSILTDTGQWRHLHVGPFDGGTLPAQVISLLHELAHVVGRIPRDDSSPTGLAISQQNTELILQHCRTSANRAEKSATDKLLAKTVN